MRVWILILLLLITGCGAGTTSTSSKTTTQATALSCLDNGTVRAHGSSWSCYECNTCGCNDGRVSVTLLLCGEN